MTLNIDDTVSDNPYFIPSKYRSPMIYVVRNILEALNGYNDYVATLPMQEDQIISLYEAIERSWCLEYLRLNKIISYVENENGDIVTVINRYALELLLLLLEGKKQAIKQLPNLVYYQPSSGRGFVNGTAIKLKKLNKRLFDSLFMAAPEPASRDTLKKAVRTGKSRNNGSAYDISQAFTNLRKACKVSAKVISLQDSGKLEAQVITLGASFFDNESLTD